MDANTETNTNGGIFDAADAFLTRMKGKGAEGLPIENEAEEDEREPVEDQEDEDQHEETPSEDESESEDTDDEEAEGEDKDEDTKSDKIKSEDDVIVKVKVDGVEHDVPVKDLKRLYGQETALNRKSQEVATQRKQIEETGAKQTVALTKMLERAQERAQPYANLDFLALTKNPNISGDELTALRDEAQKAFDDVNFYSQELDSVYRGAQEQRAQNIRSQAIEAHKVLNDPVRGIDGWSQNLYNDIRTFAITNGLDANFVNEMTDPAAIKLLHKAMQFDKGQKALNTTTKVVKTATKIIKSSSAENVAKSKPKADQKARDKLARTGSVDDAADLFFSRMTR